MLARAVSSAWVGLTAAGNPEGHHGSMRSGMGSGWLAVAFLFTGRDERLPRQVSTELQQEADLSESKPSYPVTPDGRYLVVRGRLWRRTNPALPEEMRDRLVHELMEARRAIRDARSAEDKPRESEARQRVHAAKQAMGERGPVWWTDGAPDYNRHLARNTPYATWFATLTP